MDRPRKVKLTDWDVGQELSKYSDEMCTCWEFQDSHPELFEMVQKVRREIGDAFNKLGSHGFGIYSNNVAIDGKATKKAGG